MESRDAEGRRLLFELERGLDPRYPCYLELYVRDEGEWQIVDTMQLEEIEEGGFYLSEDGALQLNYGDPDDGDEGWITHFIVRVEPALVREVFAWGADCLRLKRHDRGRVSGLAERAAALTS